MGTATSTRRRPGNASARSGRAGGADASSRTAAAGPAVLRREGGSGRIGPVRVQQLVLVQVALAVLLVAWVLHPLALAPAGAVALPLVLLAVGRRRGRALPDWLRSVFALRRRLKQAGPVPTSQVDAGLAPAVECAPALRSDTFVDRRRRSVGTVGDGTFLTAVLRVEPGASALRPERGWRPLPLRLLHDALDVDGIRLESVQVVQHTQPAPAPTLPDRSVAAMSYRPLQANSGTPAIRMTWVAVKLDPELCREAVEARGGGVEGVRRCLVRVADQLVSRLTGAGFRAAVLTEEELVAALATSAVADPLVTAQVSQPDSPPVQRTEESARAWRCDDRWHTAYGIGRWPELGTGGVPLPQLAALLSSLPALATTLSLTLTGADRQAAGVAGHLRVTGRSADDLTQLRRELERMARGVKVGLVRLDREQVPGVLATMPLGGVR
ncbi:type VII secretion protein EccE [Streptomyces sp. 549]|uniref:type VII secretion protein EccE n=1 Tax=Streptomyces sp. 549 TaxID=3049076 RepID=UPI0024C44E4C|nr:type VII secretion protein EccE [Streptomyces sp. 549]MDK1475169.1 type VII secretion protein EccE [Streptomyces sp. 549]